MTERLVSSQKREQDQAEAQIRPQTLAEFIGPIARVHVRNALAVSPTQDQFLRALANHLDTETERGQFLAKARSG